MQFLVPQEHIREANIHGLEVAEQRHSLLESALGRVSSLLLCPLLLLRGWIDFANTLGIIKHSRCSAARVEDYAPIRDDARNMSSSGQLRLL